MRQLSSSWQELHEKIGSDCKIVAIENFMQQFDESNLYESYVGCGKPPVPPELMLRIAIFEILEGRPSPAQWYRDTKVNDNLKYLGRFVTPARSTFYEFRERAGKIIDVVHQQSLMIAQEVGVLNPEAGVLDGTYFRSLGSRHRMLKEEQINARAAQLEQAIETPMQEEKLEKWMGKTHQGRQRQAQQYAKAREVMKQRQLENARRPKNKQTKRSHIVVSPSDPEAIITRDKEKVFGPVYNVQNLVDPQSLLILSTDVFASATDSRKLGEMIDRANRSLNNSLKEVWADSGYCSILDIQDAQARQVELFAKVQSNATTSKKNKAKGEPKLPRDEFKYVDEKNVYQCPAGHEAPFVDKSQVWRSGNEYLTEYRYRMNVEHCSSCLLKDRCLGPTAKSRTIKRLEGSELTEAMTQKMATPEGKERSKKRGQIIERTFGDTKLNRTLTKYHGYGLANAKAENGLVVLAQNIMTLHRLSIELKKSNENTAA